ncbi:MAG: beta-galactosidase [Anaerolineae bacterium]|nr:beta-galactosidase [Anaerolineae bacterium]
MTFFDLDGLKRAGRAGVILMLAAFVVGCAPESSVSHQIETPQNEAVSPPPGDEVTLAPSVDLNRVMSSPDYGMQAFLYWQEEIADRDIKLVKDAGFRWIKQEIPWREVEGAAKGAWQWENTDRVMDQIDSQELKMIARLGVQPQWAAPKVPLPEISPPENLQDFYDYVFAVAERYKGRIEAYQIWNEPNLAREWGGRPPNAAEYTELLKIGYQAVKAADPQAVVISAGLAPTTQTNAEAIPDTYFIQGMYDAGAAPYYDALGVHAAGYKSPPETDLETIAATPELNNFDSGPKELRRVYGFRHVEDMRAIMVENGDEAKKVVVLELGWSIDPRPDSPYHWHAVTKQQQDKYLQRAYAYAAEHWQPWIGVMSVIYIADPTWTLDDEQTYWSVVYPGYPQLNTAPAYYGLLTMDKVAAVN